MARTSMAEEELLKIVLGWETDLFDNGNIDWEEFVINGVESDAWEERTR